MPSPIAVVAVLVGVLLSVLWATRMQMSPMFSRTVRGRNLLTGNEKEFYGRLKRALSSNYEVMPQVAMAALMETTLPEGHPHYWESRKLFSQKIVDFLVCTKGTLDIVAVIELDDITHDAAKDARRDELMLMAGIRTVRWHSRRKPTVEQIRQAIEALT